MRGVQHPSNTRVLGAPTGWDQEDLPCGALPVTDLKIATQPCVASYWRPSADELQRLNEGRSVVLYVVGRGMPPVAVGVET